MTTGLQRFLDAQSAVFDQAIEELNAGRKTGHWMWFVFPQPRFLVRSPTAQYFGIGSLSEAHAYWSHALLNRRLRQATAAAVGASASSLSDLFGTPDDLKYRSCLTLFSVVSAGDEDLRRGLARWGASLDPVTLARIEQARSGPDRL